MKDIRVLTLKEYEALKLTIPKDQHKTILYILLITGMQYAELLKLYDNPAWNEKRNIIHLPEEAQKKHKRRQLKRTIHLLPFTFHHLLKEHLAGP